jgi:hypothetical protein
MKQVAAQLATVAAGEPCDARSIERLSDLLRRPAATSPAA